MEMNSNSTIIVQQNKIQAIKSYFASQTDFNLLNTCCFPHIGTMLNMVIQSLQSVSCPPTLFEGDIYFIGNQISFSIASNQLSTAQVSSINILLIGNQYKSHNKCCQQCTFLCKCLIFPLCFPYCNCWKKIVAPLYNLSVNAYQHLSQFISKSPNFKLLNLRVVDSCFNAQKAKIIFDIIQKTRITAFTFINEALECNAEQNEADDFRRNMQPIKLINILSRIKWGKMIL